MSENRLTRKTRDLVAERANYCCEYCRSQEQYSPDSFTIEHIKPIAKGGTNKPDNLAFSCQGCNNRKYTHTEAVDPATQTITSLYHPRQQAWSEHFVWSANFTLILGISPTGRATVEKLQLNRVGLVNLRRILVEMDEHPPNF
jgi:5-methylcytosine-specific restriction endonuclease McrA